MTTDPGLGRRVTRLENDTESLYEIVTDIRTTGDGHTGRLDRIDQRLDKMDGRFEGIGQRLEQIDESLVEVLRRLPEPS